MATDSEMNEEISRRDRQFQGAGGTKEHEMFKGDSPTAGENGRVHTMTPKPPPAPDPGGPTGPRRILKDRAPGGGSSPPVEPSSDQ
jgi:hypothetical protein